jgi:hypothetical protein
MALFRENYRRFCHVSIYNRFDILRKQSQRVAQTKPTGKVITKTMLQHEQRNQRGHNPHIRAKTALLTQVKRLLLLGERKTTLTRGSAEAIVGHAMVDALVRRGAPNSDFTRMQGELQASLRDL